MRRFICILLTMTMLLSLLIPAYAVGDSTPIHGIIDTEISPTYDKTIALKAMLKDNHVYADAEMLGTMLGYQVSVEDEYVAIFNNTYGKTPIKLAVFYYNKCDVVYLLSPNKINTYTTPFEAIKSENSAWIPLEYTLLLLSSSCMIVNNVLQITMPQKNILDIFNDLYYNQDYPFSWEEDFGYKENNFMLTGAFSHLINLFNGALKFDGSSWLQLVQQFGHDFSAYDAKYGEDMAMLLCTNSNQELDAMVDLADNLSTVFDEGGNVGKLLSNNIASDKDIGELNKLCGQYLSEIRAGNSSVTYIYNRTYHQLEQALDSAKSGGIADTVLAVQRGMKSATTVLDYGAKVAEILGYISDFSNQDKYMVDALQRYLKDRPQSSALPDATAKAMEKKIKAFKSTLLEYSGTEFTKDFIEDLAKKTAREVIGKQANVTLIAWNLASNYVPFISEGLKSADKFELSAYATVFQSDAQRVYQHQRDIVFGGTTPINAEQLMNVADICYVYLKGCYIARNAALATLSKYSGEDKVAIQPLVDYQNSINKRIADDMAILKKADADNTVLIFGFLPADNNNYLKKYDDSKLARLISTDTDDGIQVSKSIQDNDLLTIAGMLTEKSYEINSDSKGTVYILQVNEPFAALLNSVDLGYEDKQEIISEIQISSFSDGTNASLLTGKEITVRGHVMFAHTGHHLTTIVLTDAVKIGGEQSNRSQYDALVVAMQRAAEFYNDWCYTMRYLDPQDKIIGSTGFTYNAVKCDGIDSFSAWEAIAKTYYTDTAIAQMESYWPWIEQDGKLYISIDTLGRGDNFLQRTYVSEHFDQNGTGINVMLYDDISHYGLREPYTVSCLFEDGRWIFDDLISLPTENPPFASYEAASGSLDSNGQVIGS